MNRALVFIDGTICDDRHRLPLFGTPAFCADKNILNDRPVPGSVDFLNTLSQNYQIIYMGARSPVLLTVTKQWLTAQGFPIGKIYLSETLTGRLQIAKEQLSGLNIAVGIGDRWDDNLLHLTLGCKSIIVREYSADWESIQDLI